MPCITKPARILESPNPSVEKLTLDSDFVGAGNFGVEDIIDPQHAVLAQPFPRLVETAAAESAAPSAGSVKVSFFRQISPPAKISRSLLFYSLGTIIQLTIYRLYIK